MHTLTNPFLSFAWFLYESGRYDEALSLARITDWTPADVAGMMVLMTGAIDDMAEAIGRELVPILSRAMDAFEKLAGVMPE